MIIHFSVYLLLIYIVDVALQFFLAAKKQKMKTLYEIKTLRKQLQRYSPSMSVVSRKKPNQIHKRCYNRGQWEKAQVKIWYFSMKDMIWLLGKACLCVTEQGIYRLFWDQYTINLSQWIY